MIFVSILVLMEYPLREVSPESKTLISGVSILVLMEYPLREE